MRMHNFPGYIYFLNLFSSLYFVGIFNKTNILLTFVGYEVSIANRAYGTSLATAIF